MFLKSVCFTAVIAWLFYQSFWAFLLFPFVLFLVQKQERKTKLEAKREEMKKEFLHGIGVLNSALQAGLSMENAWREVERETKLLYGENSVVYQELKEINNRVTHNIPIEKLLIEFAYKYKIDEVIQFAELVDYGKRSGSNWRHIIDITVNQMSERYEVSQQIEVIVAEKKMEQQIMNVMPLGILAFLQISAPEYMSVMYHNAFGILSMTIFLIGYIAAYYLSQRILKVEL